jgi:hypothetical protein
MTRVPPLILSFLACDFALAISYLVNWALNQPSRRISFLIDLNAEANLPAWYSSIQLFLVAALLAFFVYAEFDKRRLLSWTLPAWPLLFVLLSIDEIAQIHEWLGGKSDRWLPGRNRENIMFRTTGIWMFLIGIPFFFFMVGLIFSLQKYFRGKSDVIRMFWAALIVYVGSAAGIEILSNFVPEEGAVHIFQVFSEELGEMIGGTLFLWAAYKLLCSYEFSISIAGTPMVKQRFEKCFKKAESAVRK